VLNEESVEIFDFLNFGVRIIKDGKIAYSNRKLAEILGNPANEGLKIDFINETDRERFNKLLTSDTQPHDAENIIKYWVLGGDGKERLIQERIFELTQEGKKEGFLILTKDITEVKKKEKILLTSELQKSELLDLIMEHVVFHDLTQTVIWVNKAACASVGLEAESLIGRKCYEIWHQRRIPCEDCPVLRARESGHKEIEEITSPDGRKWLIRGYPVYNNSGEMVGLVELTKEITKEKKTEKQLKESEELYRTLIETSPDGIISYNFNGEIVFANQRAKEVLGLEYVGDLTGRNFFEFVAPEDLIRAQENLKRVISRKFLRGIEYNFVMPDGQKKPTELSIAYVHDSEEKSFSFISIIRDISERKKTEKALKDSEEKFREIFHSANDAIFIHKLTPEGKLGKIIEANNVACNWTGYTRDELCNLTPLDSDNPAIRHKNIKAGKELLSTGRTTYESEMITKEGQYRPVEISSHLFLFKDEVVILSIARDITERKKTEKIVKENEEKYRTLFHHANDMIIVVKIPKNGNIGTIVDVNDLTCKKLGYEREEIIGKPVNLFIKDVNEEQIPKYYQELLTHKTITFEREIVKADQTSIFVEIKATAFKLKDQEAVLVAARDITARKSDEKIKQLAYAQIEQNIANLEVLVDRIRNPLMAIIGYSELSDSLQNEIIIKEAKKIEDIANQISLKWLEAEQFRKILREHLLSNVEQIENNQETTEEKTSEKQESSNKEQLE